MAYPNMAYYHAKWKKIVHVMTSPNLGISRIAQAGSRPKQRHRPDSDMDVIFAVTGNPSTRAFYPKLMKVLKANFPLGNTYPGGSYNVVHLNFQSGGKFELVLLPETKFDREHKSILDYKRTHL